LEDAVTPSRVMPHLGRPHIQLYAPTEFAPIRWRLLGGNNRELGRGTGEFADRESCLLGIKNLKNVIGDLDVSLQRNDANGWGWLLCLGGVSVATSGHRYDRLIRCKQGLTHFTTALETCEVGPGLTLTHSRRWSSAHSSGIAVKRDLP
jgi:hypothetical protein